MAGCLQILIFPGDLFTPYFAKQCGKSRLEKAFFFFVSLMKCMSYMAAEMKFKECLVSIVAIFMEREKQKLKCDCP